MNKKNFYIGILMALSFVIGFSSCNNKSETEHVDHNPQPEVYTCPMHPDVSLDKEGNCPKCGKALVEKKKSK